MKRNHVTKLIVVLSFFVLLIAATSSVVASPGFSGECGSGTDCHNTSGTLTLSTNSTVDAETDVPFLLQIEAGNGVDYVAIKGGWADNDLFTFSEVQVEDNSADDTNAAAGEISVTVTFTPLTNGTHTIRIWAVGPATSDLADSFDVTVTVTGETGTITPTPPPVDLVGIWRLMMIWVPAATGVILLIFGYIALKRN